MAKTAARIGKGTTIGYREVGSSGTYTKIGEVFELPFPEFENADVEATHYESPDGVEEFITGWATGQDMEVQLNYVAAQYATLLTLLGTKKSIQITLPDTATIAFDATIKKVGGAIPNKDRMTNTVTLKPSSVPVFTPPSGGGGS